MDKEAGRPDPEGGGDPKRGERHDRGHQQHAEGARSPLQPPSYPISNDESEEIHLRFRHHRPEGDQPDRMYALRSAYRQMATILYGECPPSRERSLALTKLQESMMWANAAIASRE